jgi:hypothetical protein
MNNDDLNRIESELGVKLSASYRNLMLTRSDELNNLTHEVAGETRRYFEDLLFLDVDVLISTNLYVRNPKDDDTARFFPGWWHSFLLIGTNGGGDYFCLRLQGDSHVWMIGSDCGDKPTKQYESVNEFVEDCLQALQDEQHPPPPASSFDNSLPLIERFQFQTWDDAINIKAQEADRPLTTEKLQQHGIDVDELQRAIQMIVAAFANKQANDVEIPRPPMPSEDGHFAIPFRSPAMSDPRLRSGDVDAYHGQLLIRFDLTEGAWDRMPPLKKLARLWQHRAIWKSTPPARSLKVNWSLFGQGVTRLLEALHPGTHVRTSSPEPSGGISTDSRWGYSAEYSIDSH